MRFGPDCRKSASAWTRSRCCVTFGRRQIADRHVLDHASAERAHLGHRKTSCLKGWALKTLDPLRQEAAVTTSPQMPRQRLRSILKTKLQGSDARSIKTLQSQNRSQRIIRPQINRLAALHGRLFSPRSATSHDNDQYTAQAAAAVLSCAMSLPRPFPS